MEASDFVRVAEGEFAAVLTASKTDGTFAETASAVRSHMRSATASLLRSAVARARARREVVGQRHFEWAPPPRGGSTQPVARS